jgi:hypothetical protein
MTDNYDVENQGRPEPLPAVTTCLMEKPDIDKKVKVGVKTIYFRFTLSRTVATAVTLTTLCCSDMPNLDFRTEVITLVRIN